MMLFPAIDLKNGEAVRLQQGDMARATVFNRDPAAQAQAFAQLGFEYLHVVDLDGAFAGKPMNATAVERILAVVKIPVQLGGGIRDRATIEAWLGKGVARVIIGTAAVRDPALVKELAFLLFSVADAKRWAKDAIAFNTVATSWGDLIDASRSGSEPSPADPEGVLKLGARLPDPSLSGVDGARGRADARTLLGLGEIAVSHQLASGTDKLLRLPGLPLLDPHQGQQGKGRYPRRADRRGAGERFSQRRSRRVRLTGQVKR